MHLSDKINAEEIADICRRWRISKLYIFGSAVRNELTAESDIDLLVDFAEDANWGFFDLAHLQDELVAKFNRPVDIVSLRGLQCSRNHKRRESIINGAEILYAA